MADARNSQFKKGLNSFDSVWIPCAAGVPKRDQRITIVLHGLGDSLESYRDIAQDFGILQMNYLLINAPKKYSDGYSWYLLEPHHRADVVKHRTRFNKLMAEVLALGYRPEQIFWLGHSQGCLMAFDHIMNSEHAYGGFIGVSGYVWFFRNWYKKSNSALNIPMLFTHGVRDRVIKIQNTRAQVDRLKKAGFSARLASFPKGHTFDCPDETVLIREWLSSLMGRVGQAIERRRKTNIRNLSTREKHVYNHSTI
jgi:phospholipase/carboxylesterase